MREAPRARTRRASATPRLALLVLLVLPAAGCARRAVGPPPSPLTPQRPRPGYERRVDELQAVDAHALAGRRIALDPGHGGFFRGALGVRGLTEAEVNLGVALHLRGLLEAHGAEVLMTRTDDRDFLTPTDSTLRADLTERSRLANAFEPDLFLSIHHNADAGGAHDRNEIQTYYKLGDEGPSLDAAASIHRYLVRNLGIEKHRILPGNYFVLRNSEAPALLTESSYITNPEVEERLALAAKQRLEAEALFLGLVHYFSRRIPVIEEFVARRPSDGRIDTLFREKGPLLQARISGAFDEAELTVDGRPARVDRLGTWVRWDPQVALANGRHEARLRVRLSGQGAAPERRIEFAVSRPPLTLISGLWPKILPFEGGTVAVRAEALDAFGFRVTDSVQVRLRVIGPSDGPDRPTDTLLTARGGVAWGYVRIARMTRPGNPPQGRGVRISVHLANDKYWRPAEDLSCALRGWGAVTQGAAWMWSMPSAIPLRDAIDSRGEDAADWISPDGFARFELDSTGRPLVPALRGYRLWADSILARGMPVRWTAIASGALHGRRITLDPDGGGDDPAGVGPSGTRAASYNLDVARALAAMLEGAGAQVLMARAGDDAISEVERVQASEAFHADRYLKIGHRSETPRLGAYPNSPGGRRWAERAGAEMARLGLAAPGIADDAQYPLQQTSCPALFVSASRVDADEGRMLAPGALRAEAYALFVSLAREFSTDSSWAVDSLQLRDGEGKPLAGVPVTLGGVLTLESDALGRVRFERTEPGPMRVETADPRVPAREVLLDSDRGVVLAGTRGR